VVAVPKLGRWVDSQVSRSPREALELLRAMPGPENVACPFRYAPRSTYEDGLSTHDINHALDIAPLVDVPLAGLVCGQHTVSRKIVEQYLLDPKARRPRAGQRDRRHGGLIDYPLFCRRNGTTFIHDGTHRSTATLLMGARLVRGYLADLDGLAASSAR
jgi:hypothetical protein